MSAKRYIVAVSGGVDSVVLLHKLVNVNSIPSPRSPIYIVAHFDHGIREESQADADFVRELAASFGLEYITKRAELGQGASEEAARKARYSFLEECRIAAGAEAIITAHHQDDVLETILVNILRGTSPRGMIGFTQLNIVRPFLDKPKSWIFEYAQKHDLTWREDATNLSDEYLRNYIRLTLRPHLNANNVTKLLELRHNVVENYREIDDLMKKLIVQITNNRQLSRSRFVVLPYTVQKELVACMLRMQGCSVDTRMIQKTVLAVKTLRPPKRLTIGQGFELHTDKHSVAIVKNH